MADAAELEKWRELVREEAESCERSAEGWRGVKGSTNAEQNAFEESVEARAWRSLASFLEQMEGLAGREVGVASDLSLVSVAVSWWENRRPVAWSLEDHLDNPTINVASPPEKALARAVAALHRDPDQELEAATPTTAPLEVDEERSKT